jgi:hypothetical protein
MLQRANLSWFLKLAACLRKFIPISSISAFCHVIVFWTAQEFLGGHYIHYGRGKSRRFILVSVVTKKRRDGLDSAISLNSPQAVD